MNKMLIAATLTAVFGLTACASMEQPEETTLASADTVKGRVKDQYISTGSRIPGARGAVVTATDAGDAQKQIRDNVAPYNHKY